MLKMLLAALEGETGNPSLWNAAREHSGKRSDHSVHVHSNSSSQLQPDPLSLAFLCASAFRPAGEFLLCRAAGSLLRHMPPLVQCLDLTTRLTWLITPWVTPSVICWPPLKKEVLRNPVIPLTDDEH